MDQQHWNEYYESNKEPWTIPDEVLVTEVEDMPPGRALDLGAGEGADSIWLAERGWEVTAVDYASAAIAKVEEIARNRGLKIKGVVANIVEYQPDYRYDLVIMCYMHLPPGERASMLANAAAALAPEGTLLFVGVDASDDSSDDFHGLLATSDEVVAELPDLTIERAEVVRRTLPYPEDPSYEGNGLVVRARRTADES